VAAHPSFFGEIMIFDIQFRNQKIVDAYSIADEILSGPEILNRIKDIVKLTYTEASPTYVSDDLFAIQSQLKEGWMEKIPVQSYWYKNASVVGMTNGTKKIFINENGLNRRTVKDYIRNGAHETGHYPLGYGHGSNWTQDTWRGRAMCKISGDVGNKDFSVPYILEEIVLQLAIEKGLVKK
jgi:hypothetical protein